MPIYMEISRLHRCVTIVARGRIAPDEIMGAAQKLFEAQVPEFAKVVDLLDATATGAIDPQQIERIAALLSGGPNPKRGPVAFLVDPSRGEFARGFAATQGSRPISLFNSLRQARDWLARLEREEQAPEDSTPWTDPNRQAVMFRRGQRREVPARNRPAYAA